MPPIPESGRFVAALPRSAGGDATSISEGYVFAVSYRGSQLAAEPGSAVALKRAESQAGRLRPGWHLNPLSPACSPRPGREAVLCVTRVRH